MDLAARLGGRNLPFVPFVLMVCAATGVAAGVQPKLGIELAIGITFTAAVLGSLTVGLCLFTVLSFLEVIQFGGAALSFTKIAGLLLFISWVAAASAQRDRRARALFASQPLFAWIAVAFVSWSLVSIVWSESHSTAISSTERYLLNILLLPIVFTAVRRRRDFIWVTAAFVIGAAISAGYGFMQSEGARLTGTIGDANEEAAVLVAALALSLGLVATQPPGSARRVWATFGGIAAAIGLLSTVSRGGLVAFACVLAGGILFGGRWRSAAIIVAVVAAVGTAGYFVALAPSAARQRVTSPDTTGRSDLWKVGWRMFQSNPVTGVGAGGFSVSAIHYVQDAGSLTRADLIVNVPHVVHNMYLEVLDDLGIPGLILFLMLAGASLTTALRAAGRYEQAGDAAFELMSRMVVLAILAMLAADFFLSGQYSKQLWLLLALPPALLALAPSPASGERENVF